jgi:hypothetical protein
MTTTAVLCFVSFCLGADPLPCASVRAQLPNLGAFKDQLQPCVGRVKNVNMRFYPASDDSVPAGHYYLMCQENGKKTCWVIMHKTPSAGNTFITAEPLEPCPCKGSKKSR